MIHRPSEATGDVPQEQKHQHDHQHQPQEAAGAVAPILVVEAAAHRDGAGTLSVRDARRRDFTPSGERSPSRTYRDRRATARPTRTPTTRPAPNADATERPGWCRTTSPARRYPSRVRPAT